MKGTLTQMINDYSNDTNKNNEKINVNYYYRNKSSQGYYSPNKYNKKENDNKKYEGTNSSSYNQNNNISFLTPQRKKKYYSEKTEKILNDIEDVKRSLNKIQYNMNYYNIPNHFKSNINEEENNYQDKDKFNKKLNYYNPNSDYKPNNNLKNYSFSLDINYIKEEQRKNYFPSNNLRQGKKGCVNLNKKKMKYNYQIKNENPIYNYNNNFKGDYEFFNYMNLMIGLKNRKLNQWRREFKEDNYKY